MKIVFLDAKTIGDDIDLSGFDRLGEVVKYGFSTSEQVPERIRDADVIIVNKVQVNESPSAGAGNLKLVCVTATGTNNLDKEYLDRRGNRLEKCGGLLYAVGCPAHLRHAVLSAGEAALL